MERSIVADRVQRRLRDLARRLLLVALLVAATALPRPAAALDFHQLVSIATGSRNGVYYFAGGTICRQVNGHRWQTGVRCVVEDSSGSIDNLRDVRSGLATFGIVQSDWQAQAVAGTGVFQVARPDRNLRSVFSLYPESFTVIARNGAGITHFSDLLGKRVSAGPRGSGSRATIEAVMQDIGWSEEDFMQLADIDTTDLARSLCNEDIDAAVLIIAHPNLTVEDMLTACDTRLVPVTGPAIDRLTTAHPYYFPFLIPGATYPNQPASIASFAVAATLVTSLRTPPSIVYDLVKSIFDELPTFQTRHPAFAEFGPARMVNHGRTAPLHSGARRYFREKGLLPPDEAD